MTQAPACSQLTKLGNYISLKAQSSSSCLHSKPSKHEIKIGYQLNSVRHQALRKHFAINPWVIVMGPGCIQPELINDIINLQKSRRLSIASTQWSNFRDGIEVDLLTSAHVLPLMASLHHTVRPKSIVHGVYSSLPPVIINSCTVTWSDPYLSFSQDLLVDLPKSIKHCFQKSKISTIPYVPCPRNALFFSTFIPIFYGAQHVTLCGFDPLNPSYFFSGNIELQGHIAQCLAKCDPWISAWDGRNERIPPPPETIHRQLNTIKSILNARSSTASSGGWRIKEMSRGLDLLQNVGNELNVTIDYIGSSEFFAGSRLPHASL